jgi:hypothetical protein
MFAVSGMAGPMGEGGHQVLGRSGEIPKRKYTKNTFDVYVIKQRTYFLCSNTTKSRHSKKENLKTPIFIFIT